MYIFYYSRRTYRQQPEGLGSLLIEILDFRHHAQTLAFLLLLAVTLDDTACLPLVDVFSEQAKNLAALPPVGNRPVRRLESAHCLRPFALSRVSLALILFWQLRLRRRILALYIRRGQGGATALGCFV